MRIDDEFMKKVGLESMPTEDKKAFMEQAREELEVRIGQKIGSRMSDADLDEFEKLAGNPAQVASWLDKHIPDYREIVTSVYNSFQEEIVGARDQILA